MSGNVVLMTKLAEKHEEYISYKEVCASTLNLCCFLFCSLVHDATIRSTNDNFIIIGSLSDLIDLDQGDEDSDYNTDHDNRTSGWDRSRVPQLLCRQCRWLRNTWPRREAVPRDNNERYGQDLDRSNREGRKVIQCIVTHLYYFVDRTTNEFLMSYVSMCFSNCCFSLYSALRSTFTFKQSCGKNRCNQSYSIVSYLHSLSMSSHSTTLRHSFESA